jgi:ElaB/YqjD/DUF883 family membrane-anchored ribosome-binding protein
MFKQTGASTDTKVAVLEEKVSIYEQMMKKIEDAIFAISETSQGISKMLAIHEERLEQGIRSDEVIIKMIDDLKKTVEAEDVDLSDRIDEVIERAQEKINEIDKKVEEVKKVKWMVIGIGTAIAIVVASATSLMGGILTPDNFGYKIEQRIVPNSENIKR